MFILKNLLEVLTLAYKLLTGLFLFLSSAACIASAPPLSVDLQSDIGLLHFVMRNDVILSRVTSHCTDVKVSRFTSNGLRYFDLKGFCWIKNNPQEDLDCGNYKVDARGTIDDPIQATVRKITLTLSCSKEGR